MPIQHYRNDPSLIVFRGPVIKVTISRPIDPTIAQKGEISPPTGPTVGALVDTGASTCMINPSLVKELELKTLGFRKISSASQQQANCRQFAVSLLIPELNQILTPVPVIEAPHEMPLHKFIIGRDVMVTWHMTFDLGAGRYTIAS